MLPPLRLTHSLTMFLSCCPAVLVLVKQSLRREQLAKQKDSDYMDEFEDDEVVDPVVAKKSNKLTAELELLCAASGQVCVCVCVCIMRDK